MQKKPAISNKPWPVQWLSGLRATAQAGVQWPGRLRERREFADRELHPPGRVIAVNYGEVLRSGQMAGGKVKLLHLRERWPEQEQFNVLYLVSSTPPPAALEMVRWAKEHGTKFVWNQNGVGFPAWAGVRTGEINRPMSALLRLADHVVYQSEFCRESANRWLGAAAGPSSVLINPVDAAVFKPAPAPRDPWRLLAAGTHYQPYRVLGALETTRVLLDAEHRVELTVAGAMRWQGAEAEVSAAVARLRLAEHITIRPAFSQKEAVRLYQSSHVLLHLKYLDPCPTVAIEALACGLPVIASRSGGMPELVGADGGELLDVRGDWEHAAYPLPRRIAAAVARVMTDWPTASAAARARAERLFRKESWVEAHARIFAEVLR